MVYVLKNTITKVKNRGDIMVTGGTKIPYVDETWNPVVGCTKVSAGCLNCYAGRMAVRLAGQSAVKAGKLFNPEDIIGVGKYYQVVNNKKRRWNNEVFCDEKALELPLHWTKPRRIFVNSMSDTFHEQVTIGFLTHIFDTIKQCPQHIFQILTKRPEQAFKMMWERHMDNGGWRYFGEGSYHPNIHLGTTCEDQENADKRIPYLLQCPAAVRFVSAEPLLGDIDFRLLSKETKEHYITTGDYDNRFHLDQVIIGAESLGGHPGRECKIEWVRNLVRQCKAAGVAVFVKQIHMWRVEDSGNGYTFHESENTADNYFDSMWSEGHQRGKPKRVLLKYPRDMELFPLDLQCWEYPESEVKDE